MIRLHRILVFFLIVTSFSICSVPRPSCLLEKVKYCVRGKEEEEKKKMRTFFLRERLPNEVTVAPHYIIILKQY